MRIVSLFILIVVALAGAAWGEVDRVLRHFDFEERPLGNPEDLPMHWVKAEGPGKPHYVNAQLATDRSRSGDYSFRFDLNGGSLVYRFGTRPMRPAEPGRPDGVAVGSGALSNRAAWGRNGPVIRVEPGGRYRVEGYVQTTPLKHARARITARLTDIDHRPIEGSARHSALYASKHDGEGWKRLSVEVSADSPEAVYLVIELELLQPKHYAPETLGRRTLFNQDIRGSAWFDDVTVSQVPELSLSTERPGHIFGRNDPLRLRVRVRDRQTDDLAVQLVVRDAEGRRVHQHSGMIESDSSWLTLPDLDPGWYQAELRVTGQGHPVGMQSLGFVRLADDGTAMRPDARFGIIATELPMAGWDDLPALLPLLGTGRVKVAIWSDEGGPVAPGDAGTQAFDALLEALREAGIAPTATLVDLPPEIRVNFDEDLIRRMSARGEAASWPALVQGDPEHWRPQLAYLIARHANLVEHWQLGRDGGEEFATDQAMRQVYAMVHQQFAELASRPDLAMPWPAWYELDGPRPATVALSVPASVLPRQLPLYLRDVAGLNASSDRSSGRTRVSLSLELLEAEPYGRETQIGDLAQRVIYALSAGAERIDLPLPFEMVETEEGLARGEPRETFIVMRTLTRVLGGADFRGEISLGEGIEAFLFERHGEGIIAVWERGDETALRELDVEFGSDARQVDLWGRVRAVGRGIARPASGSDADSSAPLVKIGPLPTFLVGIDARQAELRASVEVDRPLLESSFEPHTRRVLFVNPYPRAISGSVRLRGPSGWRITPAVSTFNLNPGEAFDRPITIEFPYNSFGGPKTLHAEFDIQAEQAMRFTVPIGMRLGLSDVGMQTLAFVDDGDVLVQQVVINYGDSPIDYAAFALFPGEARQQRLITNLGPGQSTVRLYRFRGATISADTLVRVGIRELEGTRILNDEVPIK